MHPKNFYAPLLLLLFIASAVLVVVAQEEDAQEREEIVLTMSMYLLVDDVQNPDPELSTERTEESLLILMNGINTVWAQAGIRFDLRTIATVPVPVDVLESLRQSEFTPFMQQLATGQTLLPGLSAINAFFVHDLNGINGVAPFWASARIFFVTDRPSVFHRRVSAHEIGHILGLHHVLDDPARLMFSGTNGMELSEEEIVVARYIAQGILDRVR